MMTGNDLMNGAVNFESFNDEKLIMRYEISESKSILHTEP